ncbi:MAG: carboxypeptidase regulatory-like domain-containing protein [Thermoplasmata archaeon]|nr:MAG: carboxypeptidase regulatory-like domain-containing protein [Thermoplasmata archaeon]
MLLLVLILMVAPLALTAASTGPAEETLSGIVFDERGLAAEGVLVRVDGTQVGVPTDDHGLFSLTGPDLDGDRTLVFSKKGYLTANLDYSLEDGGEMSFSVYLVEVEVVPGSVTGTVTSFTGDAIEGALVVVDLEGDHDLAAVTDVEGRYTILEVPPKETAYTVNVEAPGFLTQTAQVTVLSGLASVVDFTMAPESPMELVRGRVLDGRHLPLPGVTVVIEGNPSWWTTDLEGRFTALMEGRMGTRNVSLSLDGYGDVMMAVLIPDPGMAQVDLMMMTSGEGGPETLYVQVLSEWTGEPIPGVSVSLEGKDVQEVTDSAGVVMLTGPDLEGDVTVVTTKTSHTSSRGVFNLENGGTGVMTLWMTRASNAVTLSGMVVDGSTDLPVAHASVMINSGGILWTTRTDDNGAFQVHNLPPGVTTTVTIMAEGYVMAEVYTVLQEYQANIVFIQLEAEAPKRMTLDGTITDGTDPVAGARLTLWNTDGHMAVAHSDETGTFLFTDLPVDGGTFTYRVEHFYFMTAEHTLEPPAGGGRVTVELTLEAATKTQTVIEGWVRDPDGFPIDAAMVSFVGERGTGSTLTMDGHYMIVLYSLLSNQEFIHMDLTATADGYGRNTRNAVIWTEATNWVNLTLPLGADHGNLLGTVRTSGEKPLAGAEVQLSMGGAFRQTTSTGTDGSYAFRLVPTSDQPYQLSVVAGGYNGITMEASVQGGRTTWYNLVVQEDVTSVETIHGAVTNNEGTPVANAVVRIGGTWNVVTDANGTFVLVGEDLEGRWSVSASLSGFENTFHIIEVPSGATVSVDLVLDVMDSEATTVAGRVMRASSGKPLEGATVRLSRSASSTWTFEAVTGPAGTFEFRGVPLAWDAVAVTVSFPGYHDDVARALLSDSEISQLEFNMQRVVQPEPAEPMMTESEARQVGAGVTITAGAIILILMTEVGRVALLGLILVPLYTKIKREKVMDHFVRGRIYEFVCQNPGVNYSAIKDQFKLTNGTVTYHLSMLERQEFIRAKQDGIYKRYFANNGGPSASEVEPMSLQLTIAKTIREHPGMTQKEIAKHLGSSKQLVSYHIRRMKKEGQLETRRDGRSVRVFPNHLTPE